LEEHGYGPGDWRLIEVPGAFEIPLVALAAARSGRFAGVLTLGCVIRGATPHFEYVCLAAAMGCLQAALNTGKPVAFGVLTTENEAQARERSSPDDFNKGREAALALLDTLKALDAVK
jgi:6,7-dimethyl-8-ribityllumazine synthase